MEEIKRDGTRRRHTFIRYAGVTVLVLLTLVSIAGASPFAYITNSGSNDVSVIDTATNNVTASVPVGNKPIGVGVTPNGSKVYVTNYGSYPSYKGTVSVINTATNQVTATVNVEDGPRGIAVNPEGTKVYVANMLSNTVSIIDIATDNVIATLPVGDRPHGIAVIPDGKKVYVTNIYVNMVSEIDTTTNQVTVRIPVGITVMGAATTPDGKKVYVTNWKSGNVSVIDTATNQVTATVNTEGSPYGVAVAPDGKKVYVTDGSFVHIIDSTTDTGIVRIPIGGDLSGVAITSDGKHLYVTNTAINSVQVIDTATNQVTATVRVGDGPIAFGQFISPLPVTEILPVANFSTNITSGSAPLSVQFTDLSTNATEWNWDFGDRATSIEQSPVHTYSAAGTYNVNLTAINSNGRNSKTATISVLTPPPTINSITVPLDPIPVNTSITTSANVTYLGSLDKLTAEWDWGDGSTSESQISSDFITSHVYSSPGVYTVTFTVKDNNGEIAAQKAPNCVVVYDPQGGFVTGGGWINSPVGAYVPDNTLAGKATFGFVSKYQKGASVPTGKTEFQFKVANLNFHSENYDWLVVAGPQAKYKGTGTINGEGNYGFMLSAVDGAVKGDNIDRFRIKIWDKESEDIIYDNEIGTEEESEPTTAISGGSIIIHQEK